MAEFQTLTLTLTVDRVILHTVVHHSSTCTYVLNFVEIKETSWWTDGRDGCTHGRMDRTKFKVTVM